MSDEQPKKIVPTGETTKTPEPKGSVSDAELDGAAGGASVDAAWQPKPVASPNKAWE